MTYDSETPILIAGAGAAGIVLATELRRHNVPFRMVDKMPAPSAASRAFTLHSRTLEMIERWDTGLLSRYLERGLPTNGFAFNFRGLDERPVLDFTDLDTRYPYVLVHNQNETEGFIRDYLRDTFDYEPEWNTRVKDIVADTDGVTATLVHHGSNDREETVRARWLVACDGIHSAVRKSLGLTYEGDDYTGMVLQNMDVALAGFPDGHDWVHFYMGKDHFLLVVLLPGGNYRLLISDMGEAANRNLTAKEAFQMIVDRHFEGVTLGEPDWATKWEIWTRLAGTYRAGNIFLAGDSAHVHSPSGGQGMNCAMQDAQNLGWKLALVAKGKADESLLDSYEAERKPVAEQVIGGASALHEIMMAHGKGVEERIKLTKDPDWLAIAAGRVSGVSYTYRDYVEQPDGLADIGGPAIGDRAPDCLFANGRRLFELLRHTSMTLLLMPNGDEPLATHVASQIEDIYGALIRCEIVPSEEDLAVRYGAGTEGRLLLIRPDGYIGFKCLFSEAAVLNNHLDGFLTV